MALSFSSDYLSNSSSNSSEEYYCANPHCLIGRWSVTAEREELWRITSDFDNHPFLVAAVTPYCPCCGAELQTPLEIEGGYGERSLDEKGPLFDFVRTMR